MVRLVDHGFEPIDELLARDMAETRDWQLRGLDCSGGLTVCSPACPLLVMFVS